MRSSARALAFRYLDRRRSLRTKVSNKQVSDIVETVRFILVHGCVVIAKADLK